MNPTTIEGGLVVDHKADLAKTHFIVAWNSVPFGHYNHGGYKHIEC